MDLSKYKAHWIAVGGISTENKAFQFRSVITPQSVAELGKSLSEDGQKMPVVLWQRHSGELQLLCGYRRVTAVKELGWEKVLGIVIPESDMPEDDALRYNFIENLERKTLSSLDMIFACKKLSELGKSNVQIGRLIGKSENQVRRYLKVADASADVQQSVKAGTTTINDVADGVARRDGEAGVNNNKIYVKSTKKVFKAKIEIPLISDNYDVLDTYIKQLKAEWKIAINKKSRAAAKASRKEASFKAFDMPEPPAGVHQAGSKELADTVAGAVDPFNLPEGMPKEITDVYAKIQEQMGKDNPGLLEAIKKAQEEEKEHQ